MGISNRLKSVRKVNDDSAKKPDGPHKQSSRPLCLEV